MDRMSATPPMPRLLLVEDDLATSKALRALLTRKGWVVQVAATLAEGIRHLENLPEWLILDLMLPDGDGTILLRKVRDEKLDVRVGVTTGSIDPIRLQNVSELLPELFLTKPIDIDALFDGLRRD